MSNIKIIALDMDDTLLNSEKHLSSRNKEALQKASELGIQIVPATGRLYNAIPDEVRELDFINYAIVVNGANIYDVKRKEYISETAIAIEKACEIMAYAETLPLIFDTYIDGQGEFQGQKCELTQEKIKEILG